MALLVTAKLLLKMVLPDRWIIPHEVKPICYTVIGILSQHLLYTARFILHLADHCQDFSDS
jgi:hypothetical protein